VVSWAGACGMLLAIGPELGKQNPAIHEGHKDHEEAFASGDARSPRWKDGCSEQNPAIHEGHKDHEEALASGDARSSRWKDGWREQNPAIHEGHQEQEDALASGDACSPRWKDGCSEQNPTIHEGHKEHEEAYASEDAHSSRWKDGCREQNPAIHEAHKDHEEAFASGDARSSMGSPQKPVQPGGAGSFNPAKDSTWVRWGLRQSLRTFAMTGLERRALMRFSSAKLGLPFDSPWGLCYTFSGRDVPERR